MGDFMESTKEVVLEKNGLRFARVKNHESLLMDQYGRIFEQGEKNRFGFDGDGMRPTGQVGYAKH
jgi:hypothetical protein